MRKRFWFFPLQLVFLACGAQPPERPDLREGEKAPAQVEQVGEKSASSQSIASGAALGAKFAKQGETYQGSCLRKADGNVLSCTETYTLKGIFEETCKEGDSSTTLQGKSVTLSVKRVAQCPQEELIEGCAGYDGPSGPQRRIAELVWHYAAYMRYGFAKGCPGANKESISSASL